MPYIPQDRRKAMQGGEIPQTAGEVNYLITKALIPLVPRIRLYLEAHPQRYQFYNDVFGATFGACLELIRREFPDYAVYENKKAEESGDVY